MITRSTNIYTLGLVILAALLTFSSCKKDETAEVPTEEAARQEAIAFTVNSSISGSWNTTDSLYVMEGCKQGNRKAESSFELLPESVKAYLTANYSGYSAVKAFKITRYSTTTTDSYVAIILYNSKPVALKFNAEGTFVKVMELREGRNLKRLGSHLGWFDQETKSRDTISIDSLPANIKLYFADHFSSETLVSAVKIKDGSILVLSQDTQGFYATAFASTGTFIKRVYLPIVQGKISVMSESKLPAKATTFLTATFPGFAFNKVFEISAFGGIKGYLSLIDANMTKYAVLFNTNGEAIASFTVR